MVCLRGNANAGVDADGPIKSIVIRVWHNGRNGAEKRLVHHQMYASTKCFYSRSSECRIGTRGRYIQSGPLFSQ